MQSAVMPHFGDTLATLIRARNVTKTDFAAAAGIGEATLFRQLRSPTPIGNPSTYRAIAKALNLTPDELDAAWKGDDEPEPIPSNFTIRRVSGVAASDFSTQFDVDLMAEEGVPGALYPEPLEDPQLLLVVGDSMSYDGAETIEDGDLVLFGNAKEEHIPDGEIVVARNIVKRSHVVKRLQRQPAGIIRLISNNPKYRPIDVPKEHLILRRVLIVIRNRYKRNPQDVSSPGATRPPTAGGGA
jgi:hypothetical protein